MAASVSVSGTFEDGLGLLGVLVGEEGLRRQHGQDGADPLPHRISAVAVDEAVGERAPSLVSERITPGYHEALDELDHSLEGSAVSALKEEALRRAAEAELDELD
jgi:hypothetical protein